MVSIFWDYWLTLSTFFLASELAWPKGMLVAVVLQKNPRLLLLVRHFRKSIELVNKGFAPQSLNLLRIISTTLYASQGVCITVDTVAQSNALKWTAKSLLRY